MRAINILYSILGFIFLLFLLFSPATCNGVTYYRGIMGCST